MPCRYSGKEHSRLKKKKKKAHEKALLWNMAGKLEVKQAGEGWWSRVESRG